MVNTFNRCITGRRCRDFLRNFAGRMKQGGIIILWLLMLFPLTVEGQELLRNKRIFNIGKPDVERPRRKIVVPKKNDRVKTTISHEDSLEMEYQKWLKREPLSIQTPAGEYHEYVMPKLPVFNPEKMKAPQVTYKYDNGRLMRDMLPSPASGCVINFDFGQLISRKARDHARDMEHLEKAKKLMEHY